MTDIPISELKAPSGLFLNVINEGGIVALAQREYIKRILDVLLLEPTQFRTRYPEGFWIPDMQYKTSGTPVILKHMPQAGADGLPYKPYVVDREVLEKKLFVNPIVHKHDYFYLERINKCVVN